MRKWAIALLLGILVVALAAPVATADNSNTALVCGNDGGGGNC